MSDIGWDFSAPGWIEAIGTDGDATRRYVLDAPMLAWLPPQGTALDIGCGEGRFCRMMRAHGLAPTGLDPTAALLDEAQKRDPSGTYRQGRAEDLPFDDRSFDLAVFYLTLIDIPDYRAAIAEAARVLRPGGRLLIANIHSHATARPRGWSGEGSHWVVEGGERKYLAVDDMGLERPISAAWGGIRITNHHRPLSAYMGALLDQKLTLRAFQDPPFTGPEGSTKEKFTRMPWAFFMVWDKLVEAE